MKGWFKLVSILDEQTVVTCLNFPVGEKFKYGVILASQSFAWNSSNDEMLLFGSINLVSGNSAVRAGSC